MQTLSLPSQYNVPSDNFQDYFYHISGVKKSGKTSFAAQWPDHFIMEFEVGNAKHLKCNYRDISNWPEALGYIDLLEKSPSYCKTLCIDGVQAAYNLCTKHYAREIAKLKDEEAVSYAGWKYSLLQWTDFWQRLRRLNISIIANSHIEIQEHIDTNGKQYNMIAPTLSKQCKEIFDGIAHFTAMIMRSDTGRREMYIEGTSFLQCGHGFSDHFLNLQTKKPLAFIDMGDSAAEAYQNFIMAFYNQYTPPVIEGRSIKSISGENIPAPLVTHEKPKPTGKQGS